MKKSSKRQKGRRDKTGVDEIDRLAELTPCRIQDYVQGVSAYVRQEGSLADGPKKAGQIRLSNALSRALADDLATYVPELKGKIVTDERRVAGGLRTQKADLSVHHPLDGLRLAVELKPINLAVGRAIWNRFGDIRMFAVNVHLKFPFAVLGGVLVVPTYEETGTKAARQAEKRETAAAEGAEIDDVVAARDGGVTKAKSSARASARKSTIHLIDRAIERLIRAGGRKGEADAAHLLEGISVVVYDPNTAKIDPSLPMPGSGLRWDEFVNALVTAYQARFEG